MTVQAGETTSGIDASLRRVGAANGKISGTLVDPKHGPAPHRQVYILSKAGKAITKIGNLGSGKFSAAVPPSRDGYAVCVYSRSRYVAKCLPNVVWQLGSPAPSGARYVSVRAGQHKDVGDVKLHWGGRISGTVRNPTGEPVDALAYATSISHPRYTTLDVNRSDGTYKIDRLPPSRKGWRVCFEPNSSDNLVRACHGGAIWNAGPLPHNAKPVHARRRHTTEHINGVLPVGGVISGTVRSAGTGRPVGNLVVSVTDGRGHEVSSGWTDRSGRFTVNSLATRKHYRVCAKPATNVETVSSYFPGCSGHSVAVRVKHTTSGVNFRVHPAATIEGKFYGADGKPDDFATAYLYDSSGHRVATTDSDSNSGHARYRFSGLQPGTYYLCATDGLFLVYEMDLKSGWAPICYGNVPWRGGQAPVPNNATPITVGTAETVSGTSVTFTEGGTIAGAISDHTSGRGLTDIVNLYDADGDVVDSVHAGSHRGYEFAGVQPGDGYQVCFSGNHANSNGTQATYTYRGVCYQDAAWPH